MNGSGQLTLGQNGTYQGSFQEGLFHGKGTLKRPLFSYEGEWVKGKMSGQGHYKENEGVVYTGQFANGQFQGKGKLKLPTGVRLEGRFSNGLLSTGDIHLLTGAVFSVSDGRARGSDLHFGSAKYVRPDGVVMEGGFRIGYSRSDVGLVGLDKLVRDGSVTIRYENGDVLKARFTNDIIDGKAYLSYKAGGDQNQIWKSGQLVESWPGQKSIKLKKDSGWCSLIAENKWVYFSGNCWNGLADGAGIAYSEDSKERFIGEFSGGQFLKGVYLGKGIEQGGEWLLFKLDGFGYEKRNGVTSYQGQYSQGIPHGDGNCFENGTSFACRYYKGERVDQQMRIEKLIGDRKSILKDSGKSSRELMDKLGRYVKDSSGAWRDRFQSIDKRQARINQNYQFSSSMFAAYDRGMSSMASGGDPYKAMNNFISDWADTISSSVSSSSGFVPDQSLSIGNIENEMKMIGDDKKKISDLHARLSRQQKKWEKYIQSYKNQQQNYHTQRMALYVDQKKQEREKEESRISCTKAGGDWTKSRISPTGFICDLGQGAVNEQTSRKPEKLACLDEAASVDLVKHKKVPWLVDVQWKAYLKNKSSESMQVYLCWNDDDGSRACDDFSIPKSSGKWVTVDYLPISHAREDRAIPDHKLYAITQSRVAKSSQCMFDPAVETFRFPLVVSR